MKKYIFIIIMLLVTGCQKNDVNSVVKKFSDKVNNASSYNLVGKMSIKSDEEEFNYTFDVKYLENDYYKVALVNTNNSHEQIILKNNDAVYVITPAINKSFKFQSTWPNNSSQSYLLASILKDINNDKKVKLEKKGDDYILTTAVNYPNNSDLVKQQIYFDSNSNIKMVIVYDTDNKERIVTTFNKVDLRANISKDEFNLDQYIVDAKNNEDCSKTNSCNEKTTANILEDIIYPLFLPNNTYLTSSEKIDDESPRVILTFNGDRDFTIIESSLAIPDSFEIQPVFGSPVLLNDTIGILSDNSVKWSRGKIDYYLTSNNLSSSEMVAIATSMNHAMSVLGSK